MSYKPKEDAYGYVLDAYGHLTWTVSMRPSKDGGDWLACFDARRVPHGIEYEVVVNSDSGGFIDTMEHKIVPLKQAKRLLKLPEVYHYIGSNNDKMYSCRRCASSWRRHIRSLMKNKY